MLQRHEQPGAVLPHPATVQRKPAQPASLPAKPPHLATVQRKPVQPAGLPAKPSHPATVQRRAAQPASLPTKPPHPATVQRQPNTWQGQASAQRLAPLATARQLRHAPPTGGAAMQRLVAATYFTNNISPVYASATITYADLNTGTTASVLAGNIPSHMGNPHPYHHERGHLFYQ